MRHRVSSSDVTKAARAAIVALFPEWERFGDRFPAEAHAHITMVDGTQYRLLSRENAARLAAFKLGRYSRRSARLQVLCTCGKWFSTGTINQHKASCR